MNSGKMEPVAKTENMETNVPKLSKLFQSILEEDNDVETSEKTSRSVKKAMFTIDKSIERRQSDVSKPTKIALNIDQSDDTGAGPSWILTIRNMNKTKYPSQDKPSPAANNDSSAEFKKLLFETRKLLQNEHNLVSNLTKQMKKSEKIRYIKYCPETGIPWRNEPDTRTQGYKDSYRDQHITCSLPRPKTVVVHPHRNYYSRSRHMPLQRLRYQGMPRKSMTYQRNIVGKYARPPLYPNRRPVRIKNRIHKPPPTLKYGNEPEAVPTEDYIYNPVNNRGIYSDIKLPDPALDNRGIYAPHYLPEEYSKNKTNPIDLNIGNANINIKPPSKASEKIQITLHFPYPPNTVPPVYQAVPIPLNLTRNEYTYRTPPTEPEESPLIQPIYRRYSNILDFTGESDKPEVEWPNMYGRFEEQKHEEVKNDYEEDEIKSAVDLESINKVVKTIRFERSATSKGIKRFFSRKNFKKWHK